MTNSPIKDWKDLLHRLGADTESAFDRVRKRFDERFRPDRKLHLQAYRGFANVERATLGGRVLVYRDKPESAPDTTWRTLQASYRRFETDEVPDVHVQARIGDEVIDTHTDGEGYFQFDFAPPVGIPPSGMLTTSAPSNQSDTPSIDAPMGSETPTGGERLVIDLSLPDHPTAVQDGVAEIILPGADARFGIISDIDDTVLVTEATSLLKMMRLTLLESSASRVAFTGVAELYDALHKGINPVFYVSSSPWNLHEFLDDFMRINGIVSGPLMLRDFGLDRDKIVAGPHLAHKLTQIRNVLDRYPSLPFVLIGDSGQHDPEVYRDIVAEYPGRILSIYIRDVSGDVRDREVGDIVTTLADDGVDMLLVPDTLAAARHAAARGWIDEKAVARVASSVTEAREHRAPIDDQEA